MLDCYRTSQTGSDGGWVKHRLQWCISTIAVHFTFDGEGQRTRTKQGMPRIAHIY